MSDPVMMSGRSLKPTWRAMARAVAGWSPVIMMMRTPAFRHSAMAAGTSGRGGSLKPTRPRKVKVKSCWLCGQSLPCQSPLATPNTRRPRSAMVVTWRWISSRPACGRWHRSATASGAPLVASRWCDGSALENTCVIARMSGERPYWNTGVRPSCTCSVPVSQRWPIF